ncbi:kinesin [Bacillus sp. FJAT-27264]|uniref:magnesium transporter MgtE N-terminal domain-containing protein n=1 Tax=Paenibacillus sp. (strain DSM 101736 / FJAT-27264) TaxID=1850362 RepID=UPI000807BB9B|nr:kinesin [Bacillus sp. FJAT-27264]OBZ18383.1 kinesin [Bacillus sp. FJAT-27264]
MANKEIELENEGSAGKFERFLFLMIPIIFTLVLLGVLLTLFNMDIRNNVFAIANKIPILEKWIPDPPADPSKPADPKQQAQKQEESSNSTIKELKSQLSKQEENLKKITEEKTAQDSKVQALESQVDTMTKEAKAAEEAKADTTEDDYLKQVKDLAKLYAGMKPSKAAPIMENLTQEEMVQIFSVMNNASKTAILEKMDPKKAADVSIKLKEETTSSDLAIAALQSRLKQDSKAATTPASTSKNLDKEKLNQTFSTMTPANAASLLGEMYKISPDKVITILNTVSDSVRSSILGEMTKNDSPQTAKIVNRLMGGK